MEVFGVLKFVLWSLKPGSQYDASSSFRKLSSIRRTVNSAASCRVVTNAIDETKRWSRHAFYSSVSYPASDQ